MRSWKIIRLMVVVMSVATMAIGSQGAAQAKEWALTGFTNNQPGACQELVQYQNVVELGLDRTLVTRFFERQFCQQAVPKCRGEWTDVDPEQLFGAQGRSLRRCQLACSNEEKLFLSDLKANLARLAKRPGYRERLGRILELWAQGEEKAQAFLSTFAEQAIDWSAVQGKSAAELLKQCDLSEDAKSLTFTGRRSIGLRPLAGPSPLIAAEREICPPPGPPLSLPLSALVRDVEPLVQEGVLEKEPEKEKEKEKEKENVPAVVVGPLKTTPPVLVQADLAPSMAAPPLSAEQLALLQSIKGLKDLSADEAAQLWRALKRWQGEGREGVKSLQLGPQKKYYYFQQGTQAFLLLDDLTRSVSKSSAHVGGFKRYLPVIALNLADHDMVGLQGSRVLAGLLSVEGNATTGEKGPRTEEKISSDIKTEDRFFRMMAAAAPRHEGVVTYHGLMRLKESSGHTDYFHSLLLLDDFDGDLKSDPLVAPQSVIQQLIAGLQALRRQGIIHRDIKLGNLLWRTSPPTGVLEVALTDFGLATTDEEIRPQDLAGTPGQLSPFTVVQAKLKQLDPTLPLRGNGEWKRLYDDYGAAVLILRLFAQKSESLKSVYQRYHSECRKFHEMVEKLSDLNLPIQGMALRSAYVDLERAIQGLPVEDPSKALLMKLLPILVVPEILEAEISLSTLYQSYPLYLTPVDWSHFLSN